MTGQIDVKAFIDNMKPEEYGSKKIHIFEVDPIHGASKPHGIGIVKGGEK